MPQKTQYRDRFFFPGPPEYRAAAIPIKCLAAWLPENPRPSPKSIPLLELKYETHKLCLSFANDVRTSNSTYDTVMIHN